MSKKSTRKVKAPTKADTLNSISATGVRVTYRSPDQPWIIAIFRDRNYVEFTATGNISFPGAGEDVELQGAWEENSKYGMQFKVSNSFILPPTTTTGLENYLVKQVDGVGPVLAKSMVSTFGMDLINVIEKTPNKLTRLSGVSPAKAIKISDSWHSDQVNRHLSIYLAKHEISIDRKYDILAVFGPDKAISTIEANPYELTKVHRIGFVTADRIAKGMGYKEDSIERVAAAVVFCLQEATQEGHCFLQEGDIIGSVVAMTKCTEAQIGQAINDLVASEQVKVEPVADPVIPDKVYRLVYLPYIYHSERRLAKNIKEILNSPIKKMGSIKTLIDDFEIETGTVLSTRQRAAVQNAFDHRLSIITGAPGTGKTQTIRAIIYVAEKTGINYNLSAPTGRAARRISEVTGQPAKTLHRLLEYRDRGEFNKDHDNPFGPGIQIVDEFSMPDILLANSFFDAVGNSTNVVLVGDVDQLPAIGPGTVLRDLISYGDIPVTTLDTIFRQGGHSLIVQNAHRIRKGEAPVFLAKGTEADSYAMMAPRTSHANGKAVEDIAWVKASLTSLVKTHIPRYMAADKSFSPIRDIQVVVPMKKGTAGVYELNELLREQLNKDGRKFIVNGREWRINDRVMQMSNNYELDVSNGDVGFIRKNDPESKEVTIEFYSTTVTFKYSEMNNLDLAYASTIHKVQGSEYPVVIVVMLWQHRPMLERNLLYTANTRARKMAVYITSPGVTQAAADNVKVQNRNSFLMQRLAAG